MVTPKPSSRPRASRPFDAGLGVVAEAEVFALVDLGDVEGVDEDVGDEVAGMQVAELVGEGEDEGGVDAGGGEEFEAGEGVG